MQRLCEPQSIAVVGASEDMGKFGGRVMHQLSRHGFAGTLYPINPRRPTVNGLTAFPNVQAVPSPPDAAIVAVPPGALLATVEDCAAGGVGVAIVITGNLSSSKDEHIGAQSLEREIVATARAGGMRLLGPNCLGVINAPARLAFSPSVTMAVDQLPIGPVGIASQSGALMTAMFMRGHDAGIGFSSCISVGNQADLELADAFEYLIDDPATGAICLYVEGVKDLSRFRAAAQRARATGKPVVAVKAGRTRAGAAMAGSHTGALAGSHDAFCALARSLGVVITDQAEAAVLCAHALATYGAPRAAGLAVLSSSGGAAVLASDAVAEDGQLSVATPEQVTRDALAAFTPHPVESAMIDFGGYYRPFLIEEIAATLQRLAEDPDVGSMVYVMTPQPLMTEVAAELAALSERQNVPIALVSSAGSIASDVHAFLRGHGFPVHTSMDDALRVLRALDDFRHAQDTMAQTSDAPDWNVEATTLAALGDGFTVGPMTEPETKSLLAGVGIAVNRERLVRSADEAVESARAFGFPVVMKGVARGLIHKSDVGAVRLGLANEQALRDAYASIHDAVREHAPRAEWQGCVLQEMVTDGVLEAFVGARHDPQHGPVVLVGAGGVLVEVLNDVAVLAAPTRPSQVLGALEKLACWPLFAGVRGRPAADVQALAALVCQVSHLLVDVGPRLAELDINPVLVRAKGAGAVGLDARAVWANPLDNA